MSWSKIRYNEKSQKKFGWHPSWLEGHKYIDDDFIMAVMTFQEQHDLKADGLIGPVTFRRLLSHHEVKTEEDSISHLIMDGVMYPVDFKVVQDPISPKSYKKYRSKRDPHCIVTHWDATTSAKTCKRVLEARNLSTHFCIDNDGTIYQYLDTNHRARHAGKINSVSIGIDFSNAYYTKYNKTYVKRGFGKRPILDNSRVHGIRLKPHLGYYPEQLKAYVRLISMLCDHHDIEMKVPTDEYGNLITKVHQPCVDRKFKGVMCHYHLTRNKIDCAGLDLKGLVDEAKRYNLNLRN